MGIFGDKEVDFSKEETIEGKFFTTLPTIMGYEIVDQKGMFYDESHLSGLETTIKDLKKKALKAGCNAIVNVRITKGQADCSVVVYGEGVIVRK